MLHTTGYLRGTQAIINYNIYSNMERKESKTTCCIHKYKRNKFTIWKYISNMCIVKQQFRSNYPWIDIINNYFLMEYHDSNIIPPNNNILHGRINIIINIQIILYFYQNINVH
eukprot:160103_1